MTKNKVQPAAQDDDQDYQAQSDADILTKAQEIHNDPDRHEKATAHLGTRAKNTADAHKAARRKLHGKVKQGLNKAFGNPAEQEQKREQAGAEQIVNTKE